MVVQSEELACGGGLGSCRPEKFSFAIGPFP